MRLALLLLLSSGCLYVGWDDVPDAKVRAALHASYLAYDNGTYWSAEVANAVAIWNATALAAGCPPFSLTEDPAAHPIRLVPRAAWQYASTYRRDVHLRVPQPRGRRLHRDPRTSSQRLHELGHAIGLLDNVEAGSVMNDVIESVTSPHARDIARMRDALGC
jgi:hypothetical protein